MFLFWIDFIITILTTFLDTCIYYFVGLVLQGVFLVKFMKKIYTVYFFLDYFIWCSKGCFLFYIIINGFSDFLVNYHVNSCYIAKTINIKKKSLHFLLYLQ